MTLHTSSGPWLLFPAIPSCEVSSGVSVWPGGREVNTWGSTCSQKYPPTSLPSRRAVGSCSQAFEPPILRGATHPSCSKATAYWESRFNAQLPLFSDGSQKDSGLRHFTDTAHRHREVMSPSHLELEVRVGPMNGLWRGWRSCGGGGEGQSEGIPGEGHRPGKAGQGHRAEAPEAGPRSRDICKDPFGVEKGLLG